MTTRNSLIKNLAGYIVPVVIVVVAYMAFRTMGQGEPPVRRKTSQTQQELIVAPVVVHDDVLLLEADGVVVPFREIQLATQVAGRIARKSPRCRAGNYVEKGQELFQIDDRDYTLEVSRLSKQLEQSTLQMEEVDLDIRNVGELIEIAQEDLQLQLNEYNRLKRLEDGQVITATDVERSQRAVLMSRTTLTQLSGQFATLGKSKYRMQAGTELAGIQLEKARLDAARTTVIAPVGGVITRDLVEEDSFSQKGATLVTIEDTSHVEVKCNLRMDDLYWIWNQQQASSEEGLVDQYELPETPVDVMYELVGRVGATYHWQGRLERYDGLGLDQETRTVPVRVVVDQPHRERTAGDSGPSTLVRGMYVTIKIRCRPVSPLIRIPERAVQPGNRVWFVTPGEGDQGELGLVNKINLVRTVGEGNQADWIIDNSTGIFQPGQLIVVRPFTGASPGEAVKYSLLPADVIPAESPGEATE
ncbi:MAG: HlyD family efflux transporter periplasmic adaptor subunit [Planctomycetota bacterium]|nr:HlyD family efflux transporter periplasmic adaptor subunit [Planctomycetota bacterium]